MASAPLVDLQLRSRMASAPAPALGWHARLCKSHHSLVAGRSTRYKANNEREEMIRDTCPRAPRVCLSKEGQVEVTFDHGEEVYPEK